MVKKTRFYGCTITLFFTKVNHKYNYTNKLRPGHINIYVQRNEMFHYINVCRSCLFLATHQILSLTFHKLLIVIETRSIGELIVNSTQIKRTFGITKTTFVIKCCHEHIIKYPATRLLTLLLFSMRRILFSMIKYASHVKAVHKY